MAVKLSMTISKAEAVKEGASARAYISALRTSVMSLYEVSDIVRDTSFRTRDLVRGGDPILISEKSATRSLKQWDLIATRVVQIGSQMHISRAVLPYDRDASEKILKLLRNLSKRADKEQQKLAGLVRRDVNDPAIANAFSQLALLRAAAPTITTVWLIDIIDRATAPQILTCVTPKEMSSCSVRCIIPSRLAPRPTTSGWRWAGVLSFVRQMRRRTQAAG
jgi:hypothetical protein